MQHVLESLIGRKKWNENLVLTTYNLSLAWLSPVIHWVFRNMIASLMSLNVPFKRMLLSNAHITRKLFSMHLVQILPFITMQVKGANGTRWLDKTLRNHLFFTPSHKEFLTRDSLGSSFSSPFYDIQKMVWKLSWSYFNHFIIALLCRWLSFSRDFEMLCFGNSV